jgi:hypothetical protein
LILSNDLGYANTKQLKIDLDEIGRMLGAYIKSITRK